MDNDMTTSTDVNNSLTLSLDAMRECLAEIRAQEGQVKYRLFAISSEVEQAIKQLAQPLHLPASDSIMARYMGIPYEVVHSKERLLELARESRSLGEMLAVVGLPDEWTAWVTYMLNRPKLDHLGDAFRMSLLAGMPSNYQPPKHLLGDCNA